jgi:UrcA family protein
MQSSIKTQSQSITSMMLAGFAALACVAHGGTVVAQPAEPLTKIVAFGDLNLDSDQGAKVLYARLRHAAQYVCAPLEDSRDLSLKAIWQNCVENSLSDAVGRINKPHVTALHNRIAGRTSTG